jgi:chromosomal replication initiator protein
VDCCLVVAAGRARYGGRKYRGGRVTEPADCAVVWGAVNDLLFQQENLSQQRRAFLRLTSLRAIIDDTALLGVPDAYTRDQIETQLRTPITEALTRHLGRSMQVAVTIRPPEEAAQFDPLNAPTAFVAMVPVPRPAPARVEPTAAVPAQVGREPERERGGHVAAHHRDERARPSSDGGNRLNPKYTFESFVVGPSNRFAHAAALAVSEAPANAYNPLFIYGSSGLGKTHLLHAIGHYAQALGTAKSVRYVSTEEFTNDFINSVRDDKQSAFQRRYRDEVDILLIDDIQFLENRERTQEEFFHTFNTLHNANKQIVITSDRKAKDLATLEDRLRTRFEWGLVTDIKPPELETRIAILQKKQAQERLHVPKEVLEFIASRITMSIRELEGALLRVTAFASLNRSTVDLGLAEEVLRDLIPDGTAPELTVEQIMEVVSEYFGVSVDDLRGQSRSRVLVQARQVAMFLCRELTDMSLPRIGQAFGGRDHTTVMHAERKIRQLMSERRTLFNQIAELTQRIKASS